MRPRKEPFFQPDPFEGMAYGLLCAMLTLIGLFAFLVSIRVMAGI